jgi:hypothetical protein
VTPGRKVIIIIQNILKNNCYYILHAGGRI